MGVCRSHVQAKVYMARAAHTSNVACISVDIALSNLCEASKEQYKLSKVTLGHEPVWHTPAELLPSGGTELQSTRAR